MSRLQLQSLKSITLHELQVSLQQGLWLNATHIAKDYGKDLSNYWRSSGTEQYCKALINSNYEDFTDIKQIVVGRGKTQGTFIHQDLVINFLLWIGIKYKDIISIPSISESMRQKNIEIGGSIEVKNTKKISNVLYLITDGIYTKIGIATKNATRRLKQCQTGNPKKLWIEFEVFITNAREIEAKLHKEYSDKRLMGEWFKLDKSDIEDIKFKTLYPFHKDSIS